MRSRIAHARFQRRFVKSFTSILNGDIPPKKSRSMDWKGRRQMQRARNASAAGPRNNTAPKSASLGPSPLFPEILASLFPSQRRLHRHQTQWCRRDRRPPAVKPVRRCWLTADDLTPATSIYRFWHMPLPHRWLCYNGHLIFLHRRSSCVSHRTTGRRNGRRGSQGLRSTLTPVFGDLGFASGLTDHHRKCFAIPRSAGRSLRCSDDDYFYPARTWQNAWDSSSFAGTDSLGLTMVDEFLACGTIRILEYSPYLVQATRLNRAAAFAVLEGSDSSQPTGLGTLTQSGQLLFNPFRRAGPGGSANPASPLAAAGAKR